MEKANALPSDASTVVTGPASAVDNAIARYDSTTGKLIQSSAGIISDAGVLSGVRLDAEAVSIRMTSANPDGSNNINIDGSAGSVFYSVLGTNATLLNPVNIPTTNIWKFWVLVEQGPGAPFLLSYDSKYYDCPTTPFPTLGTAESQLNLLEFMYVQAADVMLLIRTVGPMF